jgi:low temperature requirement protein LtrA
MFSVIHFPLLCGVIAMAAATEEALAHPDAPLTTGARLALGGGAVLFVCGTAAAIWRATGRIQIWRYVLAPAAAVAVLALGAVPWQALGLVVLMLVAVSVVEERYLR